jgi:hypothetical protein
MDLMAKGNVDRFSLKEADETFECADDDSFWGPDAMSVRRYRPAFARKR